MLPISEMLLDTNLHPSSIILPPSPPPSPPTHPTTSLLDDIFSTSRSPSPSNASPLPNADHTPNYFNEPSDIPRLRAQHVTSGYRDGIASSRTSALQGGFDEGYSLGAVIGLRVGWMIGVLRGMDAALRGRGKARRETNTRIRKEMEKGERDVSRAEVGKEEDTNVEMEAEVEYQLANTTGRDDEMQALLKRAREELDLTHVFGPEYWDEDGVWKYEVKKRQDVKGEEKSEQEEITFQEVADQHPLLKAWREEIEQMMRKWGINERIWDGEEWESGRVE